MLVSRMNWLKSSITRSSKLKSPLGKSSRSLWRATGWTSLIVSAALLSGCKTTKGEPNLKYSGTPRDGDYYKEVATKIDYPDVGQESSEEVAHAVSPRRLRVPTKDQIWDLGLDEALRTALQNAEVIRDNGSFLSPGNRLLNNPDFTSSIHDVAIQETNTLFGQGGVEAALSEFDAQFTSNAFIGRSKQLSESTTIGFRELDEQAEDVLDFRSSLAKIFADGTSASVAHNWLYSDTNQAGPQARPFDSQWTSRPGRGQDGGLPTFHAEVRRPLWAGSGSEYTRVAGPIARRPTLQSTPNVNQGVVIARIRTDISITEFEEAVATLLKDVEETYWDLSLAYRTYDAETKARNSSLQTWREVKTGKDAGSVRGADEAQARDSYYEVRARVENSLANIFQTELRMRRLMGLAVNDGRVMRPSDEPITAEVLPDWNIALSEALTMRPELRKQKWNIKSLELQHEASRSLVRPRLDVVARYDANGLGDTLSDAYDAAISNNQNGYGVGFEFSMPLGFRGAQAQVKNYEHRMAKARSVLANQELEVSHELAATLQQVDQTYTIAKTNFNRRRAAEQRLQAFEAEQKRSKDVVDQLLRAQISLAQAEVSYFQSLIGYNKALTDLKFRKGTILRDDQVYLSESMWSPEAYEQAMRKAWARSFAFDAPTMRTEPTEFSLDGDDVVLTSAPAEWNGHVEPLVPTQELPPVPAVPPAEVPPAKRLDNRSANRAFEAEVGGLNDDSDESEDFVIPRLPRPMQPEAAASEEPMTEESTLQKPIRSDDDSFGDDVFEKPLSRAGASRSSLLQATRKSLNFSSDVTNGPAETASEFSTPIRRNDSGIEQVGASSTRQGGGVERAEFRKPIRRQ